MSGWIEVIAGSMYSGKTEELIKRVRRSEFAKLKTQVFKPKLDNRYHETKVASHDQNQIQAIPLEHITDVWDFLNHDTQVIGFDEGQFFTFELVQVCRDLAARGLRVIVAGLDMDWKGQPFEPIPTLMAIAEDVSKPRAICTTCGNLASYTQKLRGSGSQIEIGSQDNYEARCRLHFKPQIEDQVISQVPLNPVLLR
ncbi:MAG: thymidine kinase [Bdellovibrionales bacterium RIFCSPHIGHO2_01_FULL_40_29]|nr:MAG: thymidine kinase [Bdellovibrionales bacterium RIFCSPHIGHO2_01_FULL_40_29]OFZ33647.1 MAG: thymidine kinase [Bdellovibrionales bacterium RIFCSPHIGHO2_02_FULL_40_15]